MDKQKMVLTHKTFKDAQEHLIGFGFVFDFGNPIDGARFVSNKGYCFVKRLSNEEYEIFDYSDGPKLIYDSIRENPLKQSRAIELINIYCRNILEESKKTIYVLEKENKELREKLINSVRSKAVNEDKKRFYQFAEGIINCIEDNIELTEQYFSIDYIYQTAIKIIDHYNKDR